MQAIVVSYHEIAVTKGNMCNHKKCRLRVSFYIGMGAD